MTDVSLLNDVVKLVANGRGADLSADKVVCLLDKYPFFTLPAAELLRAKGDAVDADTRKRLVNRVAFSASNPDELYMVLAPDCSDHAGFYPDETPEKPSTDSVIDIFLETYGSTSPEEEEILNRLIFNPTPDYSQILAKEEEASAPVEGEAAPGSDDEKINRFILSTKREEQASKPAPAKQSTETAKQPAEAATTAGEPSKQSAEAAKQPSGGGSHVAESSARQNAPADASFSESLARIFIKQGQYDRAFEIIEQLNLNFPEKSVYFADQLRFLRKLINHRRLCQSKNQK